MGHVCSKRRSVGRERSWPGRDGPLYGPFWAVHGYGLRRVSPAAFRDHPDDQGAEGVRTVRGQLAA